MLFLLSLWACSDQEIEVSEKATIDVIEPSPITWEACSYMIEDHVCDFVYANALDETTTLYDHYGQIIVIDYFTEWCPYCRKAAEATPNFENDEIIFFSVMLENQYGNDPAVEDIERWASAYNLPEDRVLRAGRYIVDSNAEWGPDIQAFPSFIIIDEEMIIRHKIIGWSEPMIEQILADMQNP
jgi:thiol-disulfide isomerase/thioredoxin